jgi:hypothetical protein
MNFGCQPSCQSFRSARPESRMDTNFRMFHSYHTKFHSTTARQIPDSFLATFSLKVEAASLRFSNAGTALPLLLACSVDALAEDQRILLLVL